MVKTQRGALIPVSYTHLASNLGMLDLASEFGVGYKYCTFIEFDIDIIYAT